MLGCVLSLLLCRSFSSCGRQGLLSAAVCGLLIAAASLFVEHGLYGEQAQWVWLMGLRAQAQ